MSLRNRLLASLALVLVVLAVVGVVVNYSQRQFLVGQLDDRLRALEAPLELFAERPLSPAAPTERTGPPQLTDLFLAIVGTDGMLTTVVAPADDPHFRPVLGDALPVNGPVTVEAEGSSGDARVAVVQLADGTTGVAALAMGPTDDATRRLLAASAVGALVLVATVALVVVWVIRLGLRPIRQMTAAADAISSGLVDRRVDTDGLPDSSEAARLGSALNSMLDAKGAAEAQLRRFVADASHELRTPLTTLRGYSALYRSGGLADDAAMADAMRRIDAEATRMSRMVDDLLLLAELDEQHRVGHMVPVDLRVVLGDIAEDLRVVHPDRPVHLVAASPLWVLGDGDLLTQAVVVFTANATRHTPAGTSITLTGQTDDGRVRVEVTDEGPGVALADQSHLFERFYRADRSRTRSSGGSGLGLAIVASIVALHQGTCGVRSSPGDGATFWMDLPTTTTTTTGSVPP